MVKYGSILRTEGDPEEGESCRPLHPDNNDVKPPPSSKRVVTLIGGIVVLIGTFVLISSPTQIIKSFVDTPMMSVAQINALSPAPLTEMNHSAVTDVTATELLEPSSSVIAMKNNKDKGPDIPTYVTYEDKGEDELDEEMSKSVAKLNTKFKGSISDDPKSKAALKEIEDKFKALPKKDKAKQLGQFIEVANKVYTIGGKFKDAEKNDDAAQSISAIFDVAALGAALVPGGAMLSPIFLYISSVFMSLKKEAEAHVEKAMTEEDFKEIINTALRTQTNQELNAKAAGDLNLMYEKLGKLKGFIEEDVKDLIKYKVNKVLKYGDFDTYGAYALGEVYNYIDLGWERQHGKREHTEFIGDYLYCFSRLFLMRIEILFLLESLYVILGEEVMVRSTQRTQATFRQTFVDKFSGYKSLSSPEFGTENPAYDNIHQLLASKRKFVEAYLEFVGVPMEGYVCTIHSGPNSPYQAVWGPTIHTPEYLSSDPYSGTHIFPATDRNTILWDSYTEYQDDHPIGAIQLFVPPSAFDHERVGAYTNVLNNKPDLKDQLFRKIPLPSKTTLNGKKYETFKLYAVKYGGYVKIGDDGTTEKVTSVNTQSWIPGKSLKHVETIKKYHEGDEFFVEVRRITRENENYAWFLDKEGRLTSVWASKPMFPITIATDKVFADRPFIMMISNFKNNYNEHHDNSGSYTDSYFPKGFHFKTTNSY